ncbi:MAG: hypothetical protein ACRC2Y_07750 [Aeromonas veronii]
MRLICSIGSCLSANVAYQMHKLIPNWYRVSSVQHNRIDQLNSIYIERKYKPLGLSDIGFELSAEYKHVNTVDNQIKGVGLGRSLPKKDDPLPLIDVLDCIDFGKIDIFIFDNFAELLFKLYRHRKLNTPMFINEHYLTGKAELFVFENKFMSPIDVYESYSCVFKYISSKNPACKIVFIPFPIKLKSDEHLNVRYQEQLTVLNELKGFFNNLYIIPERDIQQSDLLRQGDIYHFNDSCYLNYARDLIREII